MGIEDDTTGAWVIDTADAGGSGDRGATHREYWAESDKARYGFADSDGVRPIAPPYGMSSQDLWRYQRDFTDKAAMRLLSVGRDQYDDGDHQRFENMGVDELVTGLREELLDVVNYCTMIDIQLQRAFKELS
jgi:hypothetical protein